MFKAKFCMSMISAILLTSLCCMLYSPSKTYAYDITVNASGNEKVTFTPLSAKENDEEITVMTAGGQVKMNVEEYIVCVVAGEVSPTYHEEALKAQAVAARTYLYYKKANGGCTKGCDICTDYKHCQAYKDFDKMRLQWGDNYEKYITAIRNAVNLTKGEIITYGNSPICALYHSSSVGKTEDCVSVFGGNRPYLVSVETPLDENDSEFSKETVFTKKEFTDKINSYFPDINADKIDIKIVSYTNAGRVDTVSVSSKIIKATSLRTAIGLRSTDFTFENTGDKITFIQKGYGHGVGMSQHGALSLALSGKNYREILLHYYTGCTVECVE